MKRKITPSDFRVVTGKGFHLKHHPTRAKALYQSEKEFKELLAADVHELSELQQRLYGSNRYALLLIFQGIDTAGKDGAIRHVLSGVNPQGCEVHSFKQPTAEELDHDFLWPAAQRLPGRGRIGVFNRSYYEEVLITRVHPALIANEHIPERDIERKDFWDDRYRSIVNFERHLHQNGTRIVKFFLHLSKEEQRRRLVARIDEPAKNWKFSQADVDERKFWGAYGKAYEQCVRATSTQNTPWYVVPADDKDNARLIISRIVIDTLQHLDIAYPTITRAQREKLLDIRRQLSR